MLDGAVMEFMAWGMLKGVSAGLVRGMGLWV